MTTTTASIAPADATDRIHAYFRLCEDIAKLLAYLIVASYAAVQALREQFDDITGRRPIDHSTKAALPRIEILYPVQQDVSPVRAAALSTVPVKELRQQAAAQAHAHQGQHQPRQARQRQGGTLQHGGQQQQHKRLDVVDHGGNRNAAVGVGPKQAQPVGNQRGRPQQQPQGFAPARPGPGAGPQQPCGQAQPAQQAAQPHHPQHGQTAFHHQQADGAGQDHGQHHAPGAPGCAAGRQRGRQRSRGGGPQGRCRRIGHACIVHQAHERINTL
jgi:hypothetical protein